MNKSIYNKITTAATLFQPNTLKEVYEYLLAEKENLDMFFDAFLENNKNLFSEKNTAQRITYDKKFAEYSEIENNLKTAKFYMERLNVI